MLLPAVFALLREHLPYPNTKKIICIFCFFIHTTASVLQAAYPYRKKEVPLGVRLGNAFLKDSPSLPLAVKGGFTRLEAALLALSLSTQ